MRSKTLSFLYVMAGVLAMPGATDATDESQPAEQRSPKVEAAIHHDLSPPLFLIPPALWQAITMEHEVRLVPRPPPAASGATAPTMENFVTPEPAIPGTALNIDVLGQGFVGPAGAFTMTIAPADPAGDVGPNHFVDIVNSEYAVFNKSGTPIFGPVPTNTLWSGFGGSCQDHNDGDGVVLYDPIADRWVISQFAVDGVNGTGPWLECVAVSQSPDPTGAYYRYAFSYTALNDYPKMGVWPDAYYETTSLFSIPSGAYQGGLVCAYDRARMLTGAAATQQCFNVGTSFSAMLPADLDGATLPPSGSPNYVLGLGASLNQLALWKFHVDWTNPTLSTLTGPTTIATAPFTDACLRTCVPQLGTTQRLDALGDRLMFRLAYRNFGAYESLVTNHSVAAGTSTGIRWYEIRSPGTTPVIYQQGTYAPDSSHRWMGSIAMDHAGDMALGFSVSSATLNPEIHYTGRLATDPTGQMSQGEGMIIDGPGSQTSIGRWGDYSMMAVDPSDDCTFWYVHEYIPANGSYNWRTRLGTFKFPSCTGAAPKPVPDGRFVPGTEMRAAKGGGLINVTWDATACPETGYNLYYGALGNLHALTGAICSLPTSGTAVGLLIPNNSFWIIAGANGSTVSSFGRTGTGAEESLSGWVGLCSLTSQETSASCP